MIAKNDTPLVDWDHVTVRTASHWSGEGWQHGKESCGFPGRLKLCPGNLCESGWFFFSLTATVLGGGEGGPYGDKEKGINEGYTVKKVIVFLVFPFPSRDVTN